MGQEQDLYALIKSATNFVVYQLIYDSSQPHLFKVSFASPSIVDILGVSDPMKFETWFENIHPDDRERIFQANMDASKTGKFDQTFRICHPRKSEIRWVHAISTLVGDEKVPPLHIMGNIIDITEQKLVETALTESNERFKSICETSPDLIFQIDLKGKIVYFSNLLNSLLGYCFEEVQGKPYSNFISPRTLPSAIKASEGLPDGKPILNLEIEILKKDGSYVLCEVNAGPLLIQKTLVGLQGIIRDITTRKKSEAALEEYRNRLEAMVYSRTKKLQESEARYRGIVEAMPEMVCRFLSDGTITFANNAFAKLFDSKPNELIGRNFFERISGNNEIAMTETSCQFSFEKPYPPCPDGIFSDFGPVRWIRWIGHGLFDNRGPLIEYQAVGLDITKERAAEIDKRNLEQIQRRTQKLEAIGTLSAGIAHDFNNILAVLLGNVQLAMDDVLKGSRARHNLDEIHDACLRARDMVQQILTFCRKREEELMPLDLTPVVKESVKFLRSTIPSMIEIKENLHGTCLVNSDPTQISQILMNLGVNAAHAIGNKAGMLEIGMKAITIDHTHIDRYHVPDEGNYVKLSVTDTGCGMSPEVIARAFDPYFTTKEEGVGSGMGLAVVHGIIETHGGAIWVESKPGRGAAFHMLFPVVKTKIAQKSERRHSTVKGNERILLIDDQQSLLKVEAEILRRLGYEVTATTNPMEALEIFRKEPDSFDLVYTDLTMPYMTGLTLSRKLWRFVRNFQ